MEGQSDPNKRRRRLRLADFDYSDPNRVYFLTLCARHLNNPFLNPALSSAVAEAVVFRSQGEYCRIFAYCLMPDHLHLALSPNDGRLTVPKLIQGLKTHTTRQAWQYGMVGRLWQRSYYDHIARREEDVLAICRYILENPVRKGLVEDAEAWPFSGMPDPLPL